MTPLTKLRLCKYQVCLGSKTTSPSGSWPAEYWFCNIPKDKHPIVAPLTGQTNAHVACPYNRPEDILDARVAGDLCPEFIEVT